VPPRWRAEPETREWVDAMRTATGRGMIDKWFADGRMLPVER
jgi:hypothetical protein